MDKISIVGIDLAKRIFQIHGADEKGKTILRRKLSRSELKKFILNLPSCVIAMEACGSSNYWGREFKKY